MSSIKPLLGTLDQQYSIRIDTFPKYSYVHHQNISFKKCNDKYFILHNFSDD